MCGIAPCEKAECTWGPKFRAECEARWVLAQPLEKRRQYLTDVEKRRGKAATEKLKADIERLWREGRSAKAA